MVTGLPHYYYMSNTLSKSEYLQIRISPELKSQLVAYAQDTKTPVSQVVREVLAAYLVNHPEPTVTSSAGYWYDLVTPPEYQH